MTDKDKSGSDVCEIDSSKIKVIDQNKYNDCHEFWGNSVE